MSERRRVIVMFEPLPEPTLLGDRRTKENDIVDAFARLRRRVVDYAQKYTVTGWSLVDDQEWEVSIIGGEVCQIRAFMTRGGA